MKNCSNHFLSSWTFVLVRHRFCFRLLSRKKKWPMKNGNNNNNNKKLTHVCTYTNINTHIRWKHVQISVQMSIHKRVLRFKLVGFFFRLLLFLKYNSIEFKKFNSSSFCYVITAIFSAFLNEHIYRRQMAKAIFFHLSLSLVSATVCRMVKTPFINEIENGMNHDND